MGYDLDALRAIPIGQVAERLGLQLNQRGKCHCFNTSGHKGGDTHPSMQMLNNNRFKCWVCTDMHGSTIDLVQMHQSLPFKEAVEWLAAQFGIADDKGAYGRAQAAKARAIEPLPRKPNKRIELSKHLPVYKRLLDLSNDTDPRLETYMASRYISRDVWQSYGVRFISKPSQVFGELVNSFGIDRVNEAGLTVQRGKMKQFIFRNHPVLFPFYHDDQPVFFQGRATESYMNVRYMTLATDIPFPWGKNRAKAQGYGRLYLCEGIMDALSISELGLGEAVAILGTNNYRDSFTKMFRPFSVSIIAQNDEPGLKFASSVLEKMQAGGIRSKIHHLPEGFNDVNDYLKSKRS